MNAQQRNHVNRAVPTLKEVLYAHVMMGTD